MSLATDYRPRTFDEVVEQNVVVSILQYQVDNNLLKPGYLFDGPAGTGKTTIARILASALNGKPNSAIEIDAASNNGVADIRKIKEAAILSSMQHPYKVFILDEVHMLSIAAWNALLKLLEEPPMKTVFILCTTDPQKIPATIISRCERYSFQKISYESIKNRLAEILAAEGHLIDDGAISYIAKLAQGGMRDAITLLDKCLSYSEGELSADTVVEALNIVSYSDIMCFINAVVGGQKLVATDILYRIYNKGVDLKRFINDCISVFTDLCKHSIGVPFEQLSVPDTEKTSFNACSSALKKIDCNYSEVLTAFIELSSTIKYEYYPKLTIEGWIICFRGI